MQLPRLLIEPRCRSSTRNRHQQDLAVNAWMDRLIADQPPALTENLGSSCVQTLFADRSIARKVLRMRNSRSREIQRTDAHARTQGYRMSIAGEDEDWTGADAGADHQLPGPVAVFASDQTMGILRPKHGRTGWEQRSLDLQWLRISWHRALANPGGGIPLLQRGCGGGGHDARARPRRYCWAHRRMASRRASASGTPLSMSSSTIISR